MIMTKIEFEFDTKHGLFRDALVLPDNHGLSDAEIETMKQQRLDGWIEFITRAEADDAVAAQQAQG